MPALFTHHHFALAFAKKHSSIFPFLLEKQALLTLGAQGPDPFFFYGQFPFRKRLEKEKIVQVGSWLHHQDPAIHLLALVRETLKIIEKNTSITPILLTYLLGAISHYVLDRTFHPYVFYRSGFDLNGKLSAPYHADHADFEAKLDLALIQYFAVKRSGMTPQQTLGVDTISLSMVSALYHQTYPKFPLTKTSYKDAVEDMQSVYAFIEDRFGIKKTIWTWFTGKRSVPVGLSHDPSISASFQNNILNLEHHMWKHPASRVERNNSVIELFDLALDLMDRFILLIQKGLQGYQIQLSDMEALVEGMNYDGHLFTDHMKTFSSIYPSYQGSKTRL